MRIKSPSRYVCLAILACFLPAYAQETTDAPVSILVLEPGLIPTEVAEQNARLQALIGSDHPVFDSSAVQTADRWVLSLPPEDVDRFTVELQDSLPNVRIMTLDGRFDIIEEIPKLDLHGPALEAVSALAAIDDERRVIAFRMVPYAHFHASLTSDRQLTLSAPQLKSLSETSIPLETQPEFTGEFRPFSLVTSEDSADWKLDFSYGEGGDGFPDVDGFISHEGVNYHLVTFEEGQVVGVEVEDSMTWSDHPDLPIIDNSPLLNPNRGDTIDGFLGDCTIVAREIEDNIIDIRWAVDKNSAETLGIDPDDFNKINEAIDEQIYSLNDILKSHGIGIQYRFEHHYLRDTAFENKSYTINGTAFDFFSRNGVYRTLWDEFNATEADIFIIFVQFSEVDPDRPYLRSCGYASDPALNQGYNGIVIDTNCLIRSRRRVLAHEIAHLAGADHDRDCCRRKSQQSCNNDPNYRFGLQMMESNTLTGTIMACWDTETDHVYLSSRQRHYTDEDLYPDYRPDEHDVARLLAEQLPTLAVFGKCLPKF